LQQHLFTADSPARSGRSEQARTTPLHALQLSQRSQLSQPLQHLNAADSLIRSSCSEQARTPNRTAPQRPDAPHSAQHTHQAERAQHTQQEGRVASEPLLTMLQALLCKDPAERLTVDQAMEHPWVTRDGLCTMPRCAAGDFAPPSLLDCENAIVRPSAFPCSR
jgi:serine/threonine protein kinase